MIKPAKQLKIAVAMSGGVDSSVAAKLLKDQGHKVAGIFLRFWQEENHPPIPAFPPLLMSWEKGDSLSHEERMGEGQGGGSSENKCCSSQALADARQVAAKIGLPLYVLNFSAIFKKRVVDNFLAEYAAGRTPNPCVRCNKMVKLGWLIKQAKKLGFDYVATGHYARLRRELSIINFQFPKNKKFIHKLYKARDKNKDQSYFLYALNQSELKHLLFPLADYTKPRVRQMAEKFKIPVAGKPDSQEVCFIPEKNHNEFLRRHLKLKPGSIIALPSKPHIQPLTGEAKNKSYKNIPLSRPSRQGEAEADDSRSGRGARGEGIGQHQGLPLYTIGQRKGINIGGTGPYYAAKMDYKKNILYVVNDAKDLSLYSDSLIAKNVNWVSAVEPNLPLKCRAVIRYGQKPAACFVTKIKNNYQVKFQRPLRAIAPGQSVVFYRGEEVLGGGVIK